MPKPVLKHLACVFQLKQGTDFSGHGKRAVKCPLLRQERALCLEVKASGRKASWGVVWRGPCLRRAVSWGGGKGSSGVQGEACGHGVLSGLEKCFRPSAAPGVNQYRGEREENAALTRFFLPCSSWLV